MEPSRPARWLRRVVIAGVALVMAALVLMVIKERSPKAWAVAVALPASGLYTVLLYGTRRLWVPRLARRPVRNAVLLGICNAAVVETIFLVDEPPALPQPHAWRDALKPLLWLIPYAAIAVPVMMLGAKK